MRLAGECEQLRQEVSLLREELRIKDARMARIPPRKRPHFPPCERLAILLLRASRGWTVAECARRFQLTAETIASWTRKLDDEDVAALVQVPAPVNRFPELVGELGLLLTQLSSVRHDRLPSPYGKPVAQPFGLRGEVPLEQSAIQAGVKTEIDSTRVLLGPLVRATSRVRERRG